MISYTWFEGVWEWMSGDRARGVPLLQSAQKRLLTFTAFLTFVVALVWVSLTGPSLSADRPWLALVCALVPFAFLPFPFLVLRTSIKVDVAAHAYLATLFVIVTLTAGALGGAVSTTSFFLILLPLLATLLLGVESGLVWVGVVALTFVGLHVLRGYLPAPGFELMGHSPNYWIKVEEVSLWNAIMMALLALAAGLSVANFRAVVAKSSALLLEASTKTQEAQAARAIAESVSRSRADFIANVSHEFRTPLNAIIGYSELLIETAEERGDEAGVNDTRLVLDAAEKLRSLVNDTLKLSAIDAGQVSLDIDEVDVELLVRDAISALMPAAIAKANRLDLTTDGAPTLCQSDSAKLDQCVRTLLSHAIAFTQSGVIAVRVLWPAENKAENRAATEGDAKNKAFSIQITDTGVAMSETAIEGLFEPFFHTGDAKIARFDGPNLSLALSRRLIRLMGGDVVAAPAPDGGVTFTLTAPLKI